MKTVIVAAGIIVREGRVLLTQRKAGAHLEGLWEFPGGKLELGEDPRDALARELAEELGVDAAVGDVVEVTFHRYDADAKAVLLLFFSATLLPSSPEPRALDVAAFEWVDRGELDKRRFPAADIDVLAKVAAILATG